MTNPISLADRVLDHAGAQAFRRKGWAAADLHVHTSCSHDVLALPQLHPEALYRKARTMGLDWVTFTDHDTMDAYDLIGWEREGLVTGVEITIKDLVRVGHTLHINVWTLSRRQFEEAGRIARGAADVRLLVGYLTSQGLPFAYNHPFWFPSGETPRIEAIPEVMTLFPVVEYNMHRVRRKNRLAMACARRLGKGVLAATDSHIGNLGTAYTLARGRDFREFFAAIAAGNAYLVPEDLTTRTLTREAIDWLDVIFSQAPLPRHDQSFSEVPALDWVMNRLHREPARWVKPAAAAAKSVLRGIVRTGVLEFLYTAGETAAAIRIDRRLRPAMEG